MIDVETDAYPPVEPLHRASHTWEISVTGSKSPDVAIAHDEFVNQHELGQRLEIDPLEALLIYFYSSDAHEDFLENLDEIEDMGERLTRTIRAKSARAKIEDAIEDMDEDSMADLANDLAEAEADD